MFTGDLPVHDVLHVGDKIKAVVMDDDFSCISLSTTDLEEEAEDNMRSRTLLLLWHKGKGC